MNWNKRFAFVAILGFLATSLTLVSGPAGMNDVFALAIDPTNPSTLYAGTNRGVFKSTDMGSTWAEINNGLTSFGVLGLAVDPTNPSTLYAGILGGGCSRAPTWEPTGRRSITA